MPFLGELLSMAFYFIPKTYLQLEVLLIWSWTGMMGLLDLNPIFQPQIVENEIFECISRRKLPVDSENHPTFVPSSILGGVLAFWKGGQQVLLHATVAQGQVLWVLNSLLWAGPNMTLTSHDPQLTMTWPWAWQNVDLFRNGNPAPGSQMFGFPKEIKRWFSLSYRK